MEGAVRPRALVIGQPLQRTFDLCNRGLRQTVRQMHRHMLNEPVPIPMREIPPGTPISRSPFPFLSAVVPRSIRF